MRTYAGHCARASCVPRSSNAQGARARASAPARGRRRRGSPRAATPCRLTRSQQHSPPPRNALTVRPAPQGPCPAPKQGAGPTAAAPPRAVSPTSPRLQEVGEGVGGERARSSACALLSRIARRMLLEAVTAKHSFRDVTPPPSWHQSIRSGKDWGRGRKAGAAPPNRY